MLGTFLEDPVDVPRVVAEYAAEQLGVDDPSCLKEYGERLQTHYEHAWEIQDLLGFRDFADAEAQVTAFVASRVAATRDSRRELFDRAVLWSGCCCREFRRWRGWCGRSSALVWRTSTRRWWLRCLRTCGGS
jgi:hypothetical protein